MAHFRYTREQRDAVHRRLRELTKDPANSLGKIAEAMRVEGFVGPDGKPISEQQVQGQLALMREYKMRAKAAASTPKTTSAPTPANPFEMIDLLLISSETPERIVASLKGLRGLA